MNQPGAVKPKSAAVEIRNRFHLLSQEKFTCKDICKSHQSQQEGLVSKGKELLLGHNAFSNHCGLGPSNWKSETFKYRQNKGLGLVKNGGLIRIGPDAFNNQFGSGPNYLKEINDINGLISAGKSRGNQTRVFFQHTKLSKKQADSLSGPLLRGENNAQQFRSWSAPARLAKIKPKIASSFVKKDICSSQTQKTVPKKKKGSSLRRSRSPVSVGRRSCPSQFQAISNNLPDFPNCAATQRLCEDIEIVSDGESLCFNMAQDSSSEEDEETEDGIVSDSSIRVRCGPNRESNGSIGRHTSPSR